MARPFFLRAGTLPALGEILLICGAKKRRPVVLRPPPFLRVRDDLLRGREVELGFLLRAGRFRVPAKLHSLNCAIEEVIQRSGGHIGFRSGPAGDLERSLRVSVGFAPADVVSAQSVFDDTEAHRVDRARAALSEDEKSLPADRAANGGGKLGLPRQMHLSCSLPACPLSSPSLSAWRETEVQYATARSRRI